MNDRDQALKDALKRADESRDNTFESWIIDSTDPEDECCGEQEDCENCES